MTFQLQSAEHCIATFVCACTPTLLMMWKIAFTTPCIPSFDQFREMPRSYCWAYTRPRSAEITTYGKVSLVIMVLATWTVAVFGYSLFALNCVLPSETPCSSTETLHKTFCMHLRSTHWHLIGYVIIKRRDLHEVQATRDMYGAVYTNDHRVIHSTLWLIVRSAVGKYKPLH